MKSTFTYTTEEARNIIKEFLSKEIDFLRKDDIEVIITDTPEPSPSDGGDRLNVTLNRMRYSYEQINQLLLAIDESFLYTSVGHLTDSRKVHAIKALREAAHGMMPMFDKDKASNVIHVIGLCARDVIDEYMKTHLIA